MIGLNQLQTDIDHRVYQKRDFLEQRALKLAAAWSDFDMVEHPATEIVRRYGAIRATDHGLLHLHKEPMFIALQTACVIGYTRPFTDGTGLDAKFGIYSKPEWQDLHETLFVWRERLSGELGVSFRQFVVARDTECDKAGNRYILGEMTSVLKPFRHFSLLRRMCANRKALLWKDCQDAIAECCPSLYDQTLLGLSKLKALS